jgi:CubicO group peptidase (beta-lactamase class C family)
VGSAGVVIHGSCAPGYERVRAAFAQNFEERDELGASVAVVASGRPVVNLWAGWADLARKRPWRAATLTNVWSVTKAMTALCVHILMDRAGLDPDRPVSWYWPEFAAGGKKDIPVRWVMSHRAGLAGFTAPVSVADFGDWEKVTSLLAAQEPLWEPGTVSGYHAITFGFLAGEIVRRITGQSLGAFFAAEVAGPLGADVHIGLAEKDLARCSELKPHYFTPQEREFMGERFATAHPAAAAALLNPSLKGGEANDPAWRRAQIPAANGHATALGLATVLGALADGTQRIVRPEALRTACTGQGRCTDLVLGLPLEFCLGYLLSGPEGHYGPNPAAFGHDGFGGSSVCADPQAGLAFAYVMNRMSINLADDQRRMSLLDAVYASTVSAV